MSSLEKQLRALQAQSSNGSSAAHKLDAVGASRSRQAAQLNPATAPRTQGTPLVRRVGTAKPSLIMTTEKASEVSLAELSAICLPAVAQLEKMDPLLKPFANSLFAPDAPTDRLSLTGPAIQQLDSAISDYLTLLQPYFLTPFAHKALEYLIRRFRIEQFNVPQLLACALPFHDSQAFGRLLALLHLQDHPTFLFLSLAQSASSAVARATIVQRCLADLSLLDFVATLTQRAAAIGGAAQQKCALSVFTALVLDAIAAVSNSLSDRVMHCLLPHTLKLMRSDLLEYKQGAMMIFASMASAHALSSTTLHSILLAITKHTPANASPHVLSRSLLALTAILAAPLQQTNPVFRPVGVSTHLARGFFPLASFQYLMNRQSDLVPALSLLILSSSTPDSSSLDLTPLLSAFLATWAHQLFLVDDAASETQCLLLETMVSTLPSHSLRRLMKPLALDLLRHGAGVSAQLAVTTEARLQRVWHSLRAHFLAELDAAVHDQVSGDDAKGLASAKQKLLAVVSHGTRVTLVNGGRVALDSLLQHSELDQRLDALDQLIKARASNAINAQDAFELVLNRALSEDHPVALFKIFSEERLFGLLTPESSPNTSTSTAVLARVCEWLATLAASASLSTDQKAHPLISKLYVDPNNTSQKSSPLAFLHNLVRALWTNFILRYLAHHPTMDVDEPDEKHQEPNESGHTSALIDQLVPFVLDFVWHTGVKRHNEFHEFMLDTATQLAVFTSNPLLIALAKLKSHSESPQEPKGRKGPSSHRSTKAESSSTSNSASTFNRRLIDALGNCIAKDPHANSLLHRLVSTSLAQSSTSESVSVMRRCFALCAVTQAINLLANDEKQQLVLFRQGVSLLVLVSQEVSNGLSVSSDVSPVADWLDSDIFAHWHDAHGHCSSSLVGGCLSHMINSLPSLSSANPSSPTTVTLRSLVNAIQAMLLALPLSLASFGQQLLDKLSARHIDAWNAAQILSNRLTAPRNEALLAEPSWIPLRELVLSPVLIDNEPIQLSTALDQSTLAWLSTVQVRSFQSLSALALNDARPFIFQALLPALLLALADPQHELRTVALQYLAGWASSRAPDASPEASDLSESESSQRSTRKGAVRKGSRKHVEAAFPISVNACSVLDSQYEQLCNYPGAIDITREQKENFVHSAFLSQHGHIPTVSIAHLVRLFLAEEHAILGDPSHLSRLFSNWISAGAATFSDASHLIRWLVTCVGYSPLDSSIAFAASNNNIVLLPWPWAARHAMITRVLPRTAIADLALSPVLYLIAQSVYNLAYSPDHAATIETVLLDTVPLLNEHTVLEHPAVLQWLVRLSVLPTPEAFLRFAGFSIGSGIKTSAPSLSSSGSVATLATLQLRRPGLFQKLTGEQQRQVFGTLVCAMSMHDCTDSSSERASSINMSNEQHSETWRDALFATLVKLPLSAALLRFGFEMVDHRNLFIAKDATADTSSPVITAVTRPPVPSRHMLRRTVAIVLEVLHAHAARLSVPDESTENGPGAVLWLVAQLWSLLHSLHLAKKWRPSHYQLLQLLLASMSSLLPAVDTILRSASAASTTSILSKTPQKRGKQSASDKSLSSPTGGVQQILRNVVDMDALLRCVTLSNDTDGADDSKDAMLPVAQSLCRDSLLVLTAVARALPDLVAPRAMQVMTFLSRSFLLHHSSEITITDATTGRKRKSNSASASQDLYFATALSAISSIANCAVSANIADFIPNSLQLWVSTFNRIPSSRRVVVYRTLLDSLCSCTPASPSSKLAPTIAAALALAHAPTVAAGHQTMSRQRHVAWHQLLLAYRIDAQVHVLCTVLRLAHSGHETGKSLVEALDGISELADFRTVLSNITDTSASSSSSTSAPPHQLALAMLRFVADHLCHPDFVRRMVNAGETPDVTAMMESASELKTEVSEEKGQQVEQDEVDTNARQPDHLEQLCGQLIEQSLSTSLLSRQRAPDTARSAGTIAQYASYVLHTPAFVRVTSQLLNNPSRSQLTTALVELVFDKVATLTSEETEQQRRHAELEAEWQAVSSRIDKVGARGTLSKTQIRKQQEQLRRRMSRQRSRWGKKYIAPEVRRQHESTAFLVLLPILQKLLSKKHRDQSAEAVHGAVVCMDALTARYAAYQPDAFFACLPVVLDLARTTNQVHIFASATVTLGTFCEVLPLRAMEHLSDIISTILTTLGHSLTASTATDALDPSVRTMLCLSPTVSASVNSVLTSSPSARTSVQLAALVALNGALVSLPQFIHPYLPQILLLLCHPALPDMATDSTAIVARYDDSGYLAETTQSVQHSTSSSPSTAAHHSEQVALSREARQLQSRLAVLASTLRSNLISRVSIRHLLPAAVRCLKPAFALGAASIGQLFDWLTTVFRTCLVTADDVVAHFSTAMQLCVLGMDARNSHMLQAQTDAVERRVISACVALVLKLNEAQLKTMLLRLIQWMTSSSADSAELVGPTKAALSPTVFARTLTFYRLVLQLSYTLKDIFVPYFGYFVDNLLSVFDAVAKRDFHPSILAAVRASESAEIDNDSGAGRKRKAQQSTASEPSSAAAMGKKSRKQSSDEKQSENDEAIAVVPWRDWSNQLVHFMLHGLRLALAADSANTTTQQFFAKEFLSKLVKPVVLQLEHGLWSRSAESYIRFVQSTLQPTVTQLATNMGHYNLWKGLNHSILTASRSSFMSVRLGSLLLVHDLFQTLREEWLTLLPETMPFISELLEDDDARVEKQCHVVIKLIESISGESLSRYLS